MKYNENKINDLICTAVSLAYADLMEMANEHHLSSIKLNQHEYLDPIEGKFENPTTGELKWGEVSEIIFNREIKDIVIYSEDARESAYMDEYYGDYVNIGDIVGKIYCAVCQVLEKGDICENEKE